MIGSILLAAGIARLWYAVPLLVSISLVYAATRHELMRPILEHAVRFAFGVLLFRGLLRPEVRTYLDEI